MGKECTAGVKKGKMMIYCVLKSGGQNGRFIKFGTEEGF